jgi:hypothetical protein
MEFGISSLEHIGAHACGMSGSGTVHSCVRSRDCYAFIPTRRVHFDFIFGSSLTMLTSIGNAAR